MSRRGTIAARAEDLLRQDLDALEEAWERAGAGPDRTVKVQSAGPLTLAAHLELATGRRVLLDRGAVRELSESLAEGIARHAAELHRRLGVQVVVQLDEPALPDVLAGTLEGRTILETVPAWPEPEALDVLDTTIRGTGLSVAVHCCAGSLPADLLRRSAAEAVAFDLTRVSRADLDGIGELFDSGTALVLGLVPTTAPNPVPSWREQARTCRGTLRPSRLPSYRAAVGVRGPDVRTRLGGPAVGAAGTEVGARRSRQRSRRTPRRSDGRRPADAAGPCPVRSDRCGVVGVLD